MRISTSLLAAIAAAVTLAAPAQAVNLLSEDFEGEAFGLAQTSLASLTATTGNVDVVGPSFFGLDCGGSSKCIDLDGTGAGGVIALTSNSSYAFGAGDTVRLSLDLSGNQRGGFNDDYSLSFSFDDNIMLSSYGYNLFGTDVDAGTNFVSGFGFGTSIAPGEGFGRRAIFFTPVDAGTLTFTISAVSGDDFGPIVDNISLDLDPAAAVPEPAAWALMIGGFGFAGTALRRRRAHAIA